MFGKNSGGAAWLLVCLGNPGDKYENTRHNVGFMVADEIGERQNAPIQKLKFKALTNLFTISGQKVLVMKPITYMNLSGEAVRQAVDFYKIQPDHVLVVSDDTALALGRLRIRKGGSAGGHNGLKNSILHLGTGGADPVIRPDAAQHFGGDLCPAAPRGNHELDPGFLHGAQGIDVFFGHARLPMGAQGAVNI